MAFRGGRGTLHKFNRYGFGPAIMTAVFPAYLGHTLHPAFHKVAKKWHHRILLHDETLEKRRALILEAVQSLHSCATMPTD